MIILWNFDTTKGLDKAGKNFIRNNEFSLDRGLFFFFYMG